MLVLAQRTRKFFNSDVRKGTNAIMTRYFLPREGQSHFGLIAARCSGTLAIIYTLSKKDKTRDLYPDSTLNYKSILLLCKYYIW